MYRIMGPCECPEPRYSLPAEVWLSAQSGKHLDIQLWLDTARDVNATFGVNGWNVLAAACSMGHANILEKLMKCPELHLNLYCMQNSPLNWALDGGHDDCVKILLSSSLKCRLDITDSWYRLLDHIGRQPSSWYDLVSLTSSYQDYAKLSQLLYVKNTTYELETLLAKAAFRRSLEDVKKIQEQNEDLPKKYNGTLIVVAASGTSDEIAKLLIEQPHNYPYESIEASLIVGCMKNSLCVLPVLLQNFFERYSFQTLCLAHEAATKAKHKYAIKLMDWAVTVKSFKHLPMSEVMISKIPGVDIFKVESPCEKSSCQNMKTIPTTRSRPFFHKHATPVSPAHTTPGKLATSAVELETSRTVGAGDVACSSREHSRETVPLTEAAPRPTSERRANLSATPHSPPEQTPTYAFVLTKGAESPSKST